MTPARRFCSSEPVLGCEGDDGMMDKMCSEQGTQYLSVGHGWMDRQTDGWRDGWGMDAWTDRRMDGGMGGAWVHGQMERWTGKLMRDGWLG